MKNNPKTETPATLLATYRRDIEQAGLDIQSAKKRFEIETRYHRIGVGLNILKARELYKVPNDGSRNPEGLNQHKKRSCASAAHDLEKSDFPSFEHFLSSISWLPRRTAYAYLRAAQNLALTPEHDATAIVKMRENKQLDGLSGAEWTALCSANPNGEAPEKPVPSPEQQNNFTFYQTTLSPLKEHFSTIRHQRPGMDHIQFATTAALLTHQLEALTGQSWNPTDEDPDPEHWRTLWPDADQNQIS